jgi:hypothetical protein
MSTWIDERNRTIRILRALVLDTPERKAAVQWAVARLEGLPENWIAADLCVCGAASALRDETEHG